MEDSQEPGSPSNETSDLTMWRSNWETSCSVQLHVLQQAMNFVTVNIQNTQSFKEEQERMNGKIQARHILFTADVKSL